jgi:hypothetical protein
MDEDLACMRQSGGKEMCVNVASKKDSLKVHHAGIPNGRTSTKKREHHLREHWFDEEDQ